nr:PKD domain-containing protein [uncultured Methanospirillum sp.]
MIFIVSLLGCFPASAYVLSGSYTVNNITAVNTSSTYTSGTDDVSAVYVTNFGNLSLNYCTLYTTGNTSSQENSSFYGLNGGLLANNGSHVNMVGGTINTIGTGANAAIPTGSATSINLTNVTIHASGNGGHGVMATQGASLSLSNVSIITSGTNAAPLATDRGGGNVHAVGGTISCSGTDSPGIYSTGTITVSNGSINSTGAQACVIEGANSATLANSTLTGGIADYGGVMIYQSTSGDADVGTGSFVMDGGSFTSKAGPAFFVTNTNATITLSNVHTSVSSDTLIRAAATSRWGTTGDNGGHVVFNSNNVTLNGSLSTDSISSITANLSGRSSLSAQINSSALSLTSDSSWNVSGNSTLTTFQDSSAISGTSISNIIGNGYTVTYNPNLSANSYLANKTYSLQNGGILKPLGNSSSGSYFINATAEGGGRITPSGLVEVSSGSSQTFTIRSNLGMLIDDVLVDDVSMGAVSSYTFPNVKANHTISVKFRVNFPSYIITATAGTGGSISPSGNIRVYLGYNQSFEITALDSYTITDVAINGTSLGPQDSPFEYTFTSVTSNKSIAASFQRRDFTINSSSNQWSKIVPRGNLTYPSQSNQTFITQPRPGSLLNDVLVNDTSVGGVSSWTFTNLSDDQSIQALGEPIPGQIQVFFNASPRYGPVPLTVQFNDSSIQLPTSWYWQFGDGNDSTLKDPNHTYTAPGTYTVSLRAINDKSGGYGCWNKFITATDGVIPEPTPTPIPGEISAQFDASPTSGSSPVSVQFTDKSSGNPISWIWDFGDGSSSISQNTTHSYTTSGSYTVTLIALNSKYSGSVVKQDLITVR